MLTLSELRGMFVRELFPGKVQPDVAPNVAHGVLFDCPYCRLHAIILWFRGGPHEGTFPLKRFQARDIGINTMYLAESFTLHEKFTYVLHRGSVYRLLA